MNASKSLASVREHRARSQHYRLYWLLALCLGCIWSIPARAEYCWMMGCEGNVGYVYIPASQIDYKVGVTSTTLNGDKYRVDTSGRLFREYGLPSIGSVVTLKKGSVLLRYSDLSNKSLTQEIQKFAYVFDKSNRTESAYEYRLEDFGNPMRSGARLKILSYFGDSTLSYSELFALVSVVSD